MAEIDETLRAAVEAQSEAHVRGDSAAFASHMTPGAVLQLRDANAAARIRARRYEILDVSAEDGRGTSAVRFSGGGSYVLRQTWEMIDGGWKVVSAARPADLVRVAWWRRLLPGRGGETPPERRELS